MNALIQIAALLIRSVFSFYIVLVLIRWLLAAVRADFYNPLSQFVVKSTNPPLRIIRRFIPAIGQIDTSALILMFALQMSEIYLLALLAGFLPPIWMVALSSLKRLLLMLVWIYIAAIIAEAIMSWISPLSSQGYRYSPIQSLINSLTSPLLNPIRRMIPTIGMIDLSPLIALLLLNIVMILIQQILPFP